MLFFLHDIKRTIMFLPLYQSFAYLQYKQRAHKLLFYFMLFSLVSQENDTVYDKSKLIDFAYIIPYDENVPLSNHGERSEERRVGKECRGGGGRVLWREEERERTG